MRTTPSRGAPIIATHTARPVGWVGPPHGGLVWDTEIYQDEEVRDVDELECVRYVRRNGIR